MRCGEQSTNILKVKKKAKIEGDGIHLIFLFTSLNVEECHQ